MRGRRAKIEWREDEESLYNLRRQESNPQLGRRLQVLWLLRQGKTIKEAARTVGVHYRTGQRWVAWYRQGGVEELRRRRVGRYSSHKQLSAFEDKPPAVETKTDDRLPELTAQLLPGQIIPPQKSSLKTSYRLKAYETLPAGIKRIALEQIDRALVQLINSPRGRDEAVHDARKCFKKTRAVLRLVRDEIGEEIFKRENTCYRDAGRRLAPVRDSVVLVETLDQLAEQFAGQLPPDAFAGIRKELVAKHRSVSQQILDDENSMAKVAAAIQAARPRIVNLPIEHEDFAALYGGLQRVYRRGRNRLAEAYAKPSPESFHEWRKRLKYLWYHMRILKTIWPDRLGGLIIELKSLADCLGDDHDLAELGATVLNHPEIFGDENELQLLIALIDRQCPKLEASARLPGKRIYVEEQQSFVNRIAGYWELWQAEVVGSSGPPLYRNKLSHT